MPHILVTADTEDRRGEILLQERVSLSDLESAHFSAQLIERVGWAVLDAERAELDRPRA
jgi:hypothetical protein